MKRKYKQPERPFTPTAQQFEKAVHTISNVENYNIRTFNNVVEALSIADLQDMLSLLSAPGGGPMEDKLRGVSESIDEMQTLVGLRNT